MTHKRSYSFKEGLAMMAAKDLGLDPYLAAEAGEDARSILAALRRAKITKGAEKSKHIAAAQAELRKLNPKQHAKLINVLQAKVLALQGRGGDTAVAHLEPGELVIPRRLLTPKLAQLIAAEAAKRGIHPKQIIVGNRKASINPATGTEEFGLFDEGDVGNLATRGHLKLPNMGTPSEPNGRQWLGRSRTHEGPREQNMWPTADSFGKKPSGRPIAEKVGESIRQATDQLSDTLELPGAVSGVLAATRLGRRIERFTKPLDDLALGTETLSRMSASVDAPAPRAPSWEATLYDVTDKTSDYAGEIALATGHMSLNPAWAAVTAPVASVSGAASGGALLANKGLSLYCLSKGLSEKCR